MKSRIRNMARCGSAAAVLVALTACGGGDSGPPPPATYTVGGTVTGLVGSGLEIQMSRRGHGRTIAIGPPLQINSNGAFTFDAVSNMSLVTAVDITQQPASPTQLCLIHNFVQAANVTDVE